MGPLLRSADEGADTAVWLAVGTSGGRQRRWVLAGPPPRWEHKVPWTRLDEAQFVRAGSDLWAWCAERSGWDGIPSGH